MAEPTVPQAPSAVCRTCRKPLEHTNAAAPITLLYCCACIQAKADQAKADQAKAVFQRLDQLDTDELLTVFLGAVQLLTQRGIGAGALRHGVEVVLATTARPFRATAGSPN